MVRGTVITHRDRCGKPNCRCANGEKPARWRPSSATPRTAATSVVMLKASEVESVRAATERFRVGEIPSWAQAEANAGLAEAGRPSRASRQDELSNAPAISEQADGFERSDTVYLALVGFLRGEEARGSLMRSWSPRSDHGARARTSAAAGPP